MKITPDEAWSLISDVVGVLPSDVQPLDGALGLRLAEQVCADRDLPPTNRAAMDGFAVRSADVAGIPAELRLAGEVPAGGEPPATVAPGSCVRILTGAVVPTDTDSVVMQEHTEQTGAGVIRILRAVKPGQHIRFRGEEARAGDVLLVPGAHIGPTETAVCSMIGRTSVVATRLPRVAILSTGTELREASQAVQPHQIRDSNGPMLAAMIRTYGFTLSAQRREGDDPRSIAAAIGELLAGADMLLVTGGVSVGKYDFVPAAIRDAGGDIRFHGIKVKPGKPQLFATFPTGKLLFGLPGNPLSVLVGMHELVLPTLRRLAGCPARDCRPLLRLPLAGPVKGLPDRDSHHLARLTTVDGRTNVEPLSNKGSADLIAGSGADGMIILPAASPVVQAGEIVAFRPWRKTS